MQTSNVDVIIPTRRPTLYQEATQFLRQRGFTSDGRPLEEARIARTSDVLPGHNSFKWLSPPKR